MSYQYELWMSDDSGRRFTLLKELMFFNYTRAVNQMGTFSMGMPFDDFAAQFNPWFRPDWRVEVWRSASFGLPMRLEDVYMLRKPNVYTRAEDGMRVIQFYGRNGWDLLNRRFVVQRAGTSYTTKTDYADDMMKAIVREQMLYGSAVDEDGTLDDTRAWPQDEFSVDADLGLGPSISLSFEAKRVMDVLKEIKATSFQENSDDANDRRIFFDVVPEIITGAPSGAPMGWRFTTKADLFGKDLSTLGPEFSLQNENIKQPAYSIDHLDEVNTIFVNANGRGDTQIIEEVQDATRAGASRWNRCEGITSATNETSTAGQQARGKAELEKNRPAESFPVTFLNSPGGRNVPRSLYGVDWDLGDKLRVNYASKQLDVEVNLVYVSVDENGQEEVTGRNEVNNG